jgi:hypothetical protein
MDIVMPDSSKGEMLIYQTDDESLGTLLTNCKTKVDNQIKI